MRWKKNLYVGEEAKKNQYKVMWKINHGAGVVGRYVLAIPLYQNNQLEIIDAVFLKQMFYRKRNLVIVGLAASETEALELVQQIVQETYEQTHTADIKSYLLRQMRKRNHQEEWQE